MWKKSRVQLILNFMIPFFCSDNWLRELARWSPELSVTCYYGSQDERKDMRMDILANEANLDFNVMVTT